eukprot:329626-Rhodomonas_salina.2
MVIARDSPANLTQAISSLSTPSTEILLGVELGVSPGSSSTTTGSTSSRNSAGLNSVQVGK